MKKIKVNGNESSDNRIIVDGSKIEVGFNDENVQIYGKNNDEPVPTTDIMQPPFHVVFEKSGPNFEKIRRACRTMLSVSKCTRMQELKTA